jgi:F420-0:gamma-glutamyl ligase
MEAKMAKKRLIKTGDLTIIVDEYGESSITNRILNDEAAFAMDLIMGDKSDRVPGAVVERAFEIAKLTYQHIKDNRMDTAFPFKKVYPDDQENG